MRCLSLVFLLFATAVSSAELTEQEAVARGMARPEISALLQARIGIAEGNAASAGRWDNPELEYSREALDFASGVSEERSLWIRQRLNIAGVHGLERDAAARMLVAETARAKYASREIAADIRTLFYIALHAQAHEQALSTWQSRLQTLVAAVGARVKAGDASRYDELRLKRELALVRGDWLNATAAAASARDQLFSVIGGEPVSLAGELLPPAMNTAVVADVLREHPVLEALEAEAGSAALSAKAADRKAWPEVTVGAGRREFSEPGLDADGNLLSLGVTIPIFDRGSGEARTAESRNRRLESERALTEARLAAEARGVLRAIEARRAAVLELREAAAPNELAPIAESAYEAGEIGVMELIDAHRTELAAHEAALARSLSAREAWIEWQLLKGE